MYLDEKKPGEALTTLEPWRQLLLDAADELERVGWCQHAMMNHLGNRCVVGAVASVRARQRSTLPLDASQQAENALYAIVGPIVGWNDTDGRTQDEVLDVLRSVARD